MCGISLTHLIIDSSSIQCHQFLARQLLNDGGCVAISQHVVGGAYAVAEEEKKMLKYKYPKDRSTFYLHQPVHSKEQTHILHRSIDGCQDDKEQHQRRTGHTG